MNTQHDVQQSSLRPFDVGDSAFESSFGYTNTTIPRKQTTTMPWCDLPPPRMAMTQSAPAEDHQSGTMPYQLPRMELIVGALRITCGFFPCVCFVPLLTRASTGLED